MSWPQRQDVDIAPIRFVAVLAADMVVLGRGGVIVDWIGRTTEIVLGYVLVQLHSPPTPGICADWQPAASQPASLSRQLAT